LPGRASLTTISGCLAIMRGPCGGIGDCRAIDAGGGEGDCRAIDAGDGDGGDIRR
jgi:hypothetical protein